MLDSDVARVEIERPFEAPSGSPHPLFDPQWYRDSNPDIPAHRATFGHYLSEGWRRLKSPHPLFTVEYYLQNRPDVRTAGVEPLGHFVTQGWKEGSNPHPLFDVAFYLSQAPDLGGVDPLTHYVTVGWKQGLRPNRHFDPGWYLVKYPDVRKAGCEPLSHYMVWGWKEHRKPSSEFDIEAYCRRHGLTSETNPLLDYMARDPSVLDEASYPNISAQDHDSLSLSFDASRSVNSSDEVRKLVSEQFALSRAPLVSIIVTNMNGAKHLPDLFSSLSVRFESS